MVQRPPQKNAFTPTVKLLQHTHSTIKSRQHDHILLVVSNDAIYAYSFKNLTTHTDLKI